MNWWKGLKGRVRIGEPLKKYTTFKIGGKVKFFIQPHDAADLKLLLEAAKRHNIPLFVLGAGSNLLVSDKGLGGAVVQLSAPYFRKLLFKGNSVEAGAGCRLNRFILSAKKQGLSGCEFLAGIPATIGGALAMNAGQSERGKGLATLVENVTVMDYNGRIKTLRRKDLKFGYRSSNLSSYIILSAYLKLAGGDKEEIQKRIEGRLHRRRATQDLRHASAGCIFKNPAGGIPAGKLIDLCGLKGLACADACVSKKHANFILNRGNARAEDVLKLMRVIKKEVKRKFRLDLQPEIKIWQ